MNEDENDTHTHTHTNRACNAITMRLQMRCHIIDKYDRRNAIMA